jgi:hypothetical protein
VELGAAVHGLGERRVGLHDRHRVPAEPGAHDRRLIGSLTRARPSERLVVVAPCGPVPPRERSAAQSDRPTARVPQLQVGAEEPAVGPGPREGLGQRTEAVARERRLFEPLLLGDFAATAVPAVDGYGASQVSWVIAGGNRRIIHCGDTLWHGFCWQIGRQHGPFDAAFLPINGARFGWRQPPAEIASVMTPEQAVAAAVVLGAKRLVPIHYGVAGAEGYLEEPDCVAKVAEIARRRGVRLQLLRPGEWVGWDEPKE